MNENTLYDLADLFKVFGDSTRLRILCVLMEQEICVADLADTLEMTQSAISHQLRKLREFGVVKCRREGKEVYYRAAEATKTKLLHDALEALMAIQCPMEE